MAANRLKLFQIAMTALLGLSSVQAQAPADLRVAIVVGNAAYPGAPLVNPANDAKAMSATLRAMGFVVYELRNANKVQMQETIRQAGDALRGHHGVGMLYYAGHGLQLNHRDYMIPVDARLQGPADVPGQTVDLQQVIDVFKSAGNRTNIVVLDACRENPFSASSTGKGLAPIDAPSGTFLAYATAPGNVADDGDASGENGLYTRFLIRELQAQGVRIEDVFKRVRLQVRRKSDGRQIPWEATSLEDDFFFDPKLSAAQAVDRENAFAREKADWDRVKDSGSVEPLFAFLEKYPSGTIAEQAQFRLDQLQKPLVLVQSRFDDIQPLPSGTNRYAVGDEFVIDHIDGFTGNSKRIVKRVLSADDALVVLSSGEVWTQMGGVAKNRFGVKDPAVVGSPADIAVGKRWRSAFTNTPPSGKRTTNFWEFRVTAYEDVVVPAGTFKAYRVERTGEALHDVGPVLFMTGTHWIDPRTMLTVKIELLFRRGGKIVEYGTEVLVSYKAAPRPANTIGKTPET